MALKNPFRGFRFPPEVILWAVRWYLRFAVSFRDLEGMLAERGVSVDHVSLHRWVQRFAPEIEQRIRPHLRPAGWTWHVDETYIRVGGGWRHLHRAVDGAGRSVEFLLGAARDAAAARRFFVRALGGGRPRAPRTVVTDRLAGYRAALSEHKRDGRLPEATRHRRGCWLNNPVEGIVTSTGDRRHQVGSRHARASSPRSPGTRSPNAPADASSATLRRPDCRPARPSTPSTSKPFRWSARRRS